MADSSTNATRSPVVTTVVENVGDVSVARLVELEHALDVVSDVFVLYDGEFRILYHNEANKAAMRAVGVDPDEAVGQVVWDVLPVLAGTAGERESKRAMRERVVTEWEETYHPSVRLRGRAFPTADGGLLVVAQNVTAEWRAGEEARDAALERARLFDEERRQRQAAESAADRARRLLAVAAGLSEAVTPEEVADVIFREGSATIGADACSLALLGPAAGGRRGGIQGLEFEVIRTRGFSDEAMDRYRHFPLQAGRPLSDAVLARSPLLLDSIAEWCRVYTTTPPEDVAGFEAFAAVPVVAGDRMLGGLSFSFHRTQTFDEGTRTFLDTLGRLCAQALDRSRAFEAERLERLRTETILESVEDGFITFDAKLRFTYLNRRSAVMLGMPASELLGRTIWEAFPGTDSTPLVSALRQALRERRVVHQEGFSVTVKRWLAARCYPMPDGGLALFYQDLTDQRRANDASEFLAEASRLLASSLDHETTLQNLARAAVPRLGDWCAVDIIDDPESEAWPPTVRRLAVVHEDPAKLALADELERRYPPDWSAPTGIPQVLLAGQPIFVPAISDEMLAASTDDPERLALLRRFSFGAVIIVPLVARDRTLGALTLITSESGRHYSEADFALAQNLAQRAAIAVDNARLYAAERAARTEAESARALAEEANRAKLDCLRAMSHELRTPLNTIGGYADLLSMELQGPITAAQRDALTRIGSNQRHLLGIINDILNFARLEAGQVSYQLDDVPVRDLLLSMEPMLAPQLLQKHLAFRIDSEINGLRVRADSEKARQILLNLLANAVKFTEPGGHVSVDSEADGEHVFIRVADTGIGIPPERLKDIFEPFVQVHRTLKTPTSGTGLGLAISRDLARGMGGDVTAKSTPDIGSVFTLRLPRGSAPARAP